jgi:UDP-galactopyranose mutase
MQCDVLIVGAGWAGLTMAERLASIGKHSIVIDKRRHIGGQAHDSYDAAGVLIHNYGGHLFYTDSDRIYDYVSQFTEWIPQTFTMQVFTRGRYWSFPINLQTFQQLLGGKVTEQEAQDFLKQWRVPIETPRNSEEKIVSQVGWELYRLFYEGYTQKQWGRSPRDLDPSVCGRVPIRTTLDENHFHSKYSGLPKDGYHALFNRMADHPKIQLLLGTSYYEVCDAVARKHTVCTGPIDEFFHYVHGVLPYRTMRFEFESFSGEQLLERESISGKKGFWQPVGQVNYPGPEPFTRIIEMKHHTMQDIAATTIMREYPEIYTAGIDPFYPIPAPDTAIIYNKYKEMADKLTSVSFVGRLATYRYLDQHQAVGNALAEFEKIRRIV